MFLPSGKTRYSKNIYEYDSNGNEVNQVCPGDVISLIDNSTVDGSGCQDVQYSWSIISTTNYNYETGNSSSQNPSISFSDPGSYEMEFRYINKQGLPVYSEFRDVQIKQGHLVHLLETHLAFLCNSY